MEHIINGKRYVLVPMAKDSERNCEGCVAEYGHQANLCPDLVGCTYDGNKSKVWNEVPLK
jgi:hypothetical protein